MQHLMPESSVCPKRPLHSTSLCRYMPLHLLRNIVFSTIRHTAYSRARVDNPCFTSSASLSVTLTRFSWPVKIIVSRVWLLPHAISYSKPHVSTEYHVRHNGGGNDPREIQLGVHLFFSPPFLFFPPSLSPSPPPLSVDKDSGRHVHIENSRSKRYFSVPTYRAT